MLFQTVPQTANDIRAFCARFNEGIRVEYKSTFDENVRRALPKVVSSFANSLGGVIVVGVNAANGEPQNPIEGFGLPAEELVLTVESICLQGTNPPILPRTTVVKSDVQGRVFLVIEVDESWEAPHAIENSKRVYVRTGNAANPYDLADVDLVMELVRRRAEPSALRDRMLLAARERARRAVGEMHPYVEVSITPLYPRRALCTRDDTWDFLSTQRYRGAHIFPFATVRRVADGVASFNAPAEYGQVSQFGLIFNRKLMQPHDGQFLLGDPFHHTLRTLRCANAFFRRVGYRGNVEITVTLDNFLNLRLVFLPNIVPADLDQNDYRSSEPEIVGSQITAAEHLGPDFGALLQSLMVQICWAFWQSREAFPEQEIGDYVQRILRDMGPV